MIIFDPSIRPASRPAASTGLVKALHWNRRHLSTACTTKRVKHYLRDWYVLWICSMGWLHLPNVIKGYQWENIYIYIYWSSQVPTAPVNTLKGEEYRRIPVEGSRGWRKDWTSFHTEGVLSPLRLGISIHLSGEATWWLCWAPHHTGLRSCWLGCLQTLPVLAFFPTMHWGWCMAQFSKASLLKKKNVKWSMWLRVIQDVPPWKAIETD